MNCITKSQNKFEKCIACMVFMVMQFFICYISLSSIIIDSNHYKIPEVTVTGEKHLLLPAFNYTGNSIIDKSKIEAVNPATIDELFWIIPTVVIKNYGGMGGMKTISLRGSLAAQTLITLNGNKLNSSQNGIIDLASLPISILSEIQVVRGGLSATHGSNALGGILNIVTDRNISGINLISTFGSYGDKILGLTAGLNEKNINVGAFVEYKSSEGNYPIEVNQYGNRHTYVRKNADFNMLSFGVNTKFNATQYDLFSLDFMSSFSSKGVPGAVLQGNLESLTARSNDLYSFINLNYFKILSNTASFKTSLHYRYGENHYVDEVYVPINYAGNSHFYSNDLSISNHFDFTMNNFRFRLSNEAFYTTLAGDMLDKSLDGDVSRYGTSFSISADARHIIDELDVFIASRIDFFDRNENSISPYFGLNYIILDGLVEFPLSISYNFRLPSFNELYYLNYGNYNLRPEKSVSFNIGTNFKPFSNLGTKFNLFLINTQDLILSVPRTPVLWSAQNVGIAQSRGLELELYGSFLEDKLNMSLSYTLMEVKDKESNSSNYNKLLPYFPQETIGIFMLFKLYNFILIQKFNYNSFTYSLRSNDINSVIAPYLTYDIALSVSIQIVDFTINPRIGIVNLFDERYSIIKNYPMPGRIFRFSVNMNYGDITK